MKQKTKIIVSNSLLVVAYIELQNRVTQGFHHSRLAAALDWLLSTVGGFVEPTAQQSQNELSGHSQSEPRADAENPDVSASPSAVDEMQSTTIGQSGFIQTSMLFRLLTREPTEDNVVIDLRDARLIGPPVIFFERLGARIFERSDTIPSTATVLQIGYRIWNTFLRYPLKILSLGVILLALGGLLWQVIYGGDLGVGVLVLLAVLLIGLLGIQKTHSWQDVRSYQELPNRGKSRLQPWIDDSWLLRPVTSYNMLYFIGSVYVIIGLSRVLSLGFDAAIELFSLIILGGVIVAVLWKRTKPPTNV